MIRRLRFLVPVLLLAVYAFGQETRATLSGTITDPSGAAVAGANAKLVNIETAVETTVESNQLGQYRFLFVNPGPYTLTVAQAGFRTLARQGIILVSGQAATIDLTLQLGSQSEAIVVNDKAPLLEAEKADRGMVVERESVTELPLITRTPLLLGTLAPGVVETSVRYDWTPFSNSGLSTWSINGSTANSTGFLIDGAPNDVIYGSAPSIAYVPPSDAVQEFRVVANAYDAQYGRNGGGVLSMVTKSGTNDVHGTVYEYMKRPWLNATSFSNNALGNGKDQTKLDEYGFTFGGPVYLPKVYNGKDRTFFFSAWEAYMQIQPFASVASVPTMAQRSGDFSQTFNSSGKLITIYDPSTGQLVNNQWVRTPFAGNVIPSNRIDPVGAKIAALYPAPNVPTTGPVNWQNNYDMNPNQTWYHFHNIVERVDHNFGTKERIFGRYVWNNQLMHQNSNNLPGYAADQREGIKENDGIVLDSVTILTPTTIFDLRASLTYWEQNYKPIAYGSYNGTAVGLSQSLVNQFEDPGRFPYFTASNYASIGSSSSNILWCPTATIAIAPTLTMNHGRHQIKTGVDYRWTRYASYPNSTINTYTAGTFAFNLGFTQANYSTGDNASGNSIASTLLGVPASGEVDYINKPYYRWHYLAPWVQDDIKVTRRLTVNLGLRWDLLVPVTEKHNRLNWGFFPNTVNPISSQINQTLFPGYKVNGGMGFAGVNGNPNSPYNTDWHMFQPRLGAAFQLNSKTALRGGWGLSFVNNVSTGAQNGFSQSTPYVATNNGGETPAGVVSNPFPSGLIAPMGASLGMLTSVGQGFTYADPTGKIGYVHSFSLGIQRILPGEINVEAAYVGSRANGAGVTNSINPLSVANLALGNPALGGNPTYLSASVPNPFAGLLPGTSLNNATITRQQSLLPYPEFTSISEADLNVGKMWYNALQVSVGKRASHGLMVTASYTYSKNLAATGYLNAQDPLPSCTFTAWDYPHRLVVAPVYELPFGPGKDFLNSSHGVIAKVIEGWQVSMNTTFRSGAPMSMPSNLIAIADPAIPNPTPGLMFNTGTIQANGQIIDQVNGLPPAWQVAPSNSLRTLSSYVPSLRDLWGHEYNVSFVKKVQIHERMRFEVRAEVFNLFNHPIFGGDPSTSYTSTTFGRITVNNGQTNLPRQVELAGRLTF
jgi:hypothetical protein